MPLSNHRVLIKNFNFICKLAYNVYAVLTDFILYRLWTDSWGSEPGWYLSRILITDLQTGDKYHFLCEKWLAHNKEDGQVLLSMFEESNYCIPF